MYPAGSTTTITPKAKAIVDKRKADYKLMRELVAELKQIKREKKLIERIRIENGK